MKSMIFFYVLLLFYVGMFYFNNFLMHSGRAASDL